jgi:hypothetical protein
VGGPGAGFPDNPAYPPVIGGGPILPPDSPPQAPTLKLEKKVGWTPETGWVVLYVPTGDHVTPSAAATT